MKEPIGTGGRFTQRRKDAKKRESGNALPVVDRDVQWSVGSGPQSTARADVMPDSGRRGDVAILAFGEVRGQSYV